MRFPTWRSFPCRSAPPAPVQPAGGAARDAGFFNLLRATMGIDLGGRQRPWPSSICRARRSAPWLSKVGGETVAQAVRADPPRVDPGHRARTLDQPQNCLPGQRRAAASDEQPADTGAAGSRRPRWLSAGRAPRPAPPSPVHALLAQRHQPVPQPFADHPHPRPGAGSPRSPASRPVRSPAGRRRPHQVPASRGRAGRSGRVDAHQARQQRLDLALGPAPSATGAAVSAAAARGRVVARSPRRLERVERARSADSSRALLRVSVDDSRDGRGSRTTARGRLANQRWPASRDAHPRKALRGRGDTLSGSRGRAFGPDASGRPRSPRLSASGSPATRAAAMRRSAGVFAAHALIVGRGLASIALLAMPRPCRR